jgi:hypothetical protein
MDTNLQQILEEFDSLKGQFVITASWKIERLIAIGEDDMDYYWITYNGRKITWNTCVGRVMPLKGHLRGEDYLELCRLARLNHWDQSELFGGKNIEETKNFNEGHKKEITSIEDPNKFLTEIHWEIV